MPQFKSIKLSLLKYIDLNQILRMTNSYDLDRHIRTMRHFVKTNTLLSDAVCRIIPKISPELLIAGVREIIQEFQNNTGLSLNEKMKVKKALNKVIKRKFDLAEQYRKLSRDMTNHYLDEPKKMIPKIEPTYLQVHIYEEPIPKE